MRHAHFPVITLLAIALAACGGRPATSTGPGGPDGAGTGASGAGDAAPAAEPEEVTSVEGITEYRLDNGMRVLLFPDGSKDTVTVNVTYFVGSRHEGYGETGMAHLLEHMVFKGTPDYPEIWTLLQEHGASFNGTTWVDRTNYYETLPATRENLEFAIRMEADRMVNSTISADDLKSEFSVVRNEFEMGENNPVRVLEERMFSTAFLWHNYGKSTIGSRSDIENVPVENLRAFYEKYYQPDNAMLVVAGRFDADDTLALINETFGSIARPDRTLPPTHTVEPVQDGERSVTLRRNGDVAAVGVLFHSVPGAHQDFVATEALIHLLTDEPSGRLYQALVEPGHASRVWGAAYPWQDPGTMQVFAEVPAGGPVEKVRETMMRVIDEVRSGDEPITDAEVRRYRAATLKDIRLGFTDSQRIAIALSEFAALGDWRLLFVYRDRVEEVDTAAVQRVAGQYLVKSNRTIGTFIPTKDPERAPQTEQPDVLALVDGYQGREAVSAGEDFDYTVENIEKRLERLELPGGMKLALLSKETRGDAVRAQINLRYGSLSALRGKSIEDELVGEMLMRGTQKRSYQELQDRLDELEADVRIGNQQGAATVDITTTRDNLTDVLVLVAEVLTQPSFPKEQFEVVRKEKIAGLEKALTDPQQRAFIQLLRTLRPFPKGDPRRVASVEEQIAGLKKAKLADVQRLYRKHWGASYAQMTVVGDFEPAEIEDVVTEHLAGWKSPSKFQRLESPYKDVSASEEHIDTPDKEMALIVVGHNLKIRDDHPDYAAVELINYVLGGSASSRLLERLRQKDGLSYGAFSVMQASSLDESGIALAGAILAPQNAEKGMEAMLEEIDRLGADGIGKDELEKAKASYQKEFERNLSNDRSLLNQINDGLYLDRTMRFYAERNDRLQALTPADIERVLKQHLRPDALTRITAGDAKKTTD